MKTEVSRSDLIRILKNSIELAEEATFLFENGYKRRAGFLALASIEEFLKVMHFEQSGSTKGLTLHKEKFRFMNEGMGKIFEEIIATDFTEAMGEGAEKFSPEKAKMINEYWREMMTDLSNTFRFDRLRQYFLYEDFAPSKDAIRFKASIESGLAKYVLHIAHTYLDCVGKMENNNSV